ncbi:glucose-6-phosphate isomerase [Finegoldia sp. P1-F-LS]|uniref:glucose-6-phosphate isomerase n=1 Tax=unclassified Finegoldia TaxID=2619637 RepID=UPI00406CBFE9
MFKLDFSNTTSHNSVDTLKTESVNALEKLLNKTCEGKEFTGWIDLPKNYDREEFERIKKCAKKIRETSDCLVVIGIGGSYLGAKAIDYAMSSYFEKSDIEIIYAGFQLSSTYLSELLDYLKDKDFCVNVISKSGTTTEPAIAFRFIKELMEEKYTKEELKDRIFATTDKHKGALKELSDINGYETFVVPDDIGGRFSVLTSVGLLPLCVKGLDIDKLMIGAADAMEEFTKLDYESNFALQYVSFRNNMYRNGKDIEIIVNYEMRLKYFSEWFKQLFAESEGKNNKGLFPMICNFTTDLHSVGQMIQDGQKNVFETVISVENPQKDLFIKSDDDNLDNLNYLSGKSVDYVNKMAMQGTLNAHLSSNVESIVVKIDTINEENLGYMIYFFEMSVAISALVLGVNPFNQPGVEEYKKQMFKLLEKPGY